MSGNAELHELCWTRRSNDAVSDRGKFEYFVESICGTFTGIRPERTSNRTFQAEFTALAMPGMELAHITAPGHRARRDRRLISTRPDDSIFINFEPGRAYGVRFPEDSFLAPRATPLILDNGAAFELDFDRTAAMDLFSLRLDRAALSCGLTTSQLSDINRFTRASEAGRALSQQFLLLSQAMRQGNARLCASMATSVRELLRVFVDRGAGECIPPDLERIKDVARMGLGDPAYGVSDLARRLGCSIRTVQMRFREADQTFSGWMLETRLMQADAMLADPEHAFRTIASIAHRNGFADVPRFNRAYRQRFAITPGDRRAMTQGRQHKRSPSPQ